MKAEILLSGFGGQGLMSLGKALAKAALKENKYTTWFPSYGAEVRGGTAHCYVKISDSYIASPFVDFPDIAILLNQPSLDKFQKRIKKNGILIVNSDLSSNPQARRDLTIIEAPLNTIALQCGNIRVANVVALGILLSIYPDFIKRDTIVSIIKEAFSNQEIINQNLKALSKGEQIHAG